MASLNVDDLFNMLMENNDIWSANLVLKNNFNKNVGDEDSFKRFFDFSIKIAKWNINLASRSTFLEQAKSALVFFSENGELKNETIELIQACQNEIASVQVEIDSVEQQLEAKRINEIKEKNIDLLSNLIECKMPLQKCEDQEQFHDLLKQIKNTEEQIHISFLDNEQKLLFDELTKEYPELIKNKLNEFERTRLKGYNKTAVTEFNEVFEQFKQNEDKYKNNIIELKRLVAKRLFRFETDQLYNETLIYYNHVYSYIFGSLDEEGKYRLTELAISTDKR